MTPSSRAITLSLQDHTISSSGPMTLDEDEALFQQQLQHAIEISKANAQRGEQPSASTNTFLSERAQLEKERRERQKRLRKAQGLSDSDDELRAVSDGEDLGQPNAKRQRLSSSSVSYIGQTNVRTSAVPSSSKLGPSQDSFFWDGEWRPTATLGVEPRNDGRSTFRLSEVLGDKSDIAFAILSSFALDIPWIYSLFDPSSPVIMVAQPDSSGKASVKNALPNWIKTTPFLRGGYGCMHMKFMLIFYKTGRLRVVVSTANLIPYDWRDIENAVWLQDLPPLPKEAPFKRQDNESFPSVMKRVLDAVNVMPALSTMLKQDHPNLPIKTTEQICTRWDWSNVKVNLVPSIAGKHEGWPNVILTGHVRLMKAVRNMGVRTGKGPKEKTLELECQGSSIGSYTTQWINEFYHSAQGESAEDWLDKPKSRREKLPYPVEVKVLFPTLATVRSSQHGERGGGNLFFQRSYWEGKKFPRQLFYDSRSKAGKTLMHTKMIVGSISQKVATTGPQKEVINLDTDSEESDSGEEIEVVDANVGWIYLGSHNFTPSAWGTLSGSAFNPIMNIRNYELGIVLPLKDMAEVDKLACFERPPRKYGPDDSPWVSLNI
ncbi:tyrosyl-DNA phosphodiesterase-domain-containing protein [Lentinula aff. lateritia]|uniref:Tyrosyl-DNA phosphodiesterase-domain-containing protein n=1 Tax=Lentinula aff. lateritia TaxID=2804960 RepID=A0ACC1TV29_9AGAR|nr:tyrosyl-DNA phosphodiesterase-domain-containing protein [Lentinula aff. lateritia]